MLIDKRDKKKRSQAQVFFQRSMCSVVVCKTKDCCGSLQTLEGWLWLWLRLVWNQWVQPLAKECRLHGPQCWSNCTFWPVFCGLDSRSGLRSASGSLSGLRCPERPGSSFFVERNFCIEIVLSRCQRTFFLYSLPLSNFDRKLSRPSRSSRRRLISAYPTTCHLYISPTSVPRKISRLFLGRTCFTRVLFTGCESHGRPGAGSR